MREVKFWLGWFSTFVLGSVAAAYLWYFSTYYSQSEIVATLSVPAGGGVIGTLQWLLLRKYVARAGLWILTSIAALPFGLIVVYITSAVFFFIPYLDRGLPTFALLILAFVFGCTFAYVQWVVIAWQANKAEWWIIANGLGCVLSMLPQEDVPVEFSWFFSAIILGAVQASVMVWLLHPKIAHQLR